MKSKILFRVEFIRIALLAIILCIVVGTQILQSHFINRDLIFSVYIILAGTFLLHFIYILRSPPSGSKFEKLIPLIDVIAASLLIFYTGLSQTLFIFMYLVSIILSGFLYQTIGALYVALLSSIFFTLTIILGPDSRNSAFLFVLVVNNLAFFAVAALSGYMSEQLAFVGKQLEVTGIDLRLLRNLNQLILENIPTGMMTCNSDGLIVKYNNSAEKLIGENLGGKNIFKIFGDLKTYCNFFNLRTGVRFEYEFNKNNSEKMVFVINTAPLVQHESGVRGFVFIFEDLTQLKKLEYAMKQKEKLAAVGQLAAGIAHEIRNPLASISGSIQMLSQMTSNDEDRRLMGIVLKETDRLNNLITEFLDFARPDKPVTDQMNLSALLKETLDMLKVNDKLRKDVAQKVNITPDAKIIGNKDKLKQAFLNILINSYQAMVDTVNPEINVSLDKSGEYFQLKIRDNGCGMNEENRKRMFEPFHTTKVKGTGLGLAVTHKILENHKASIFVSSEIGRGTEFSIQFPVLIENVKEA